MRSLFVMLALVAMTLAQRQSVQRELSSDLQFSNYPGTQNGWQAYAKRLEAPVSRLGGFLAVHF